MKAAGEARLLRDFGRRLAELRAERGFTQERLAEKVNLATRYLQAIEAGAENPTIRTLIHLAAALRVSVQALFEPPKSRAVRVGRPPTRR